MPVDGAPPTRPLQYVIYKADRNLSVSTRNVAHVNAARTRHTSDQHIIHISMNLHTYSTQYNFTPPTGRRTSSLDIDNSLDNTVETDLNTKITYTVVLLCCLIADK